MKKTVVVGLSGGVDSSVAAYLLKKEFKVIGLFMKNWHDESVTLSNDCPWLEDSYDAMLVAEKLNIPFQTIDLSEIYKKKIIDYMFSEYKKGRTPNPDILCNREIKFEIFLNVATSLGADFIATGHYCIKKEISKSNGSLFRLIKGKDNEKDQSYFLCQLNQKQLSKSLFPLGGFLKSEIRQIAKKLNLVTAEKKDSQGLCFIGKISLTDFLKQKLKIKEGEIIEIKKSFYENINTDNLVFNSIEEKLIFHTRKNKYKKTDGEILGLHHGAHFFTIGQRRGLSVGGMKEPLFVIDTDVNENVIYVGKGKSHPGLTRRGIRILHEDVHWIRPDLALIKKQSMDVLARIRYRQPLDKATIYNQNDAFYVIFEKPKSSIAEGQFVTWYLKDELIGSGSIS